MSAVQSGSRKPYYMTLGDQSHVAKSWREGFVYILIGWKLFHPNQCSSQPVPEHSGMLGWYFFGELEWHLMALPVLALWHASTALTYWSKLANVALWMGKCSRLVFTWFADNLFATALFPGLVSRDLEGNLPFPAQSMKQGPTIARTWMSAFFCKDRSIG